MVCVGLMYVKPGKANPAAIRKANWEAEQKRKNAAALNLVLNSLSNSKGNSK